MKSSQVTWNYVTTYSDTCLYDNSFNMYDALQMTTVFSYILNTKLYFSI